MLVLPLALCFVLLYRIARASGRCDALMFAGVVGAVYLAGITEILSLSHQLNRTAVLIAWIAADVIAGAIWLRQRRVQLRSFTQTPPQLWLVVAAVLLFVLGITGLFSAPSNWDSMTYHLPRVMHWMTNQSVADYPTNCLPQLFQPPWAEFAILHLQLLCGSDRLAFAPQWLAFAGSAAAIYSLSKKLGAGSTGRNIAVLFALTLPTAVLQAASTQNNLVLGFWLLCFVNGIVVLKTSGDIPWKRQIVIAAFTGSALGLAMLTKGTAYVLGAPLLVWLVITHLRRGGRSMGVLVTVAIVALTLNAGQWSRNMNRFGAPLAPPGDPEYRVLAMSPPLWAGNVIRNLALQVATPSRRANQQIVANLDYLQRRIGIDPDDPRTTLPGSRFALRPPHNDEDLTGNPFHLALLGVVLIVALPLRKQTGNTSAVLLILVVLAFALFCAVLKWQPFHTRLHLPLFLLVAGPVGCCLERVLNRKLIVAVSALLMLLAFAAALDNPSHPWFGKSGIFSTPRSRQYFVNRPDLYAAYSSAALLAADQPGGHIALLAGANDWEYPLWILLHDRLGRWPDIQDLPDGLPRAESLQGFDVVICVKRDRSRTAPPGWLIVPCGVGVEVWLAERH